MARRGNVGVRVLCAGVVALSLVTGTSSSDAAGPGDQWCAGTFDTQRHVAGPLRFGVDPGVAGDPGPRGTGAPLPPRQEMAAPRDPPPRRPALGVRADPPFLSHGGKTAPGLAPPAHTL